MSKMLAAEANTMILNILSPILVDCAKIFLKDWSARGSLARLRKQSKKMLSYNSSE